MIVEAILPTFRRDLGQFGILRDSLARYRGDLSRCVVVVPEADMDLFAQAIGNDPFYLLRSETVVLGRVPPKYVFDWSRKRPGRAGRWVQQLIKLHHCAHTSADWCLTLDADCIARRPVDLATMFVDGKGVDQVLDCSDLHDTWYQGSAKILGPGVKRSGVEHPVTPTLLNAEACRMLIGHLASRASAFDGNWMAMLMRRVPWSEYTLYYTYLEMIGQFDHYHRIVERPVLYNPYNAVWYPQQFAEWQPETGMDRALFDIVQSTAKADPAAIRAKLALAEAA